MKINLLQHFLIENIPILEIASVSHIIENFRTFILILEFDFLVGQVF